MILFVRNLIFELKGGGDDDGTYTEYQYDSKNVDDGDDDDTFSDRATQGTEVDIDDVRIRSPVVGEEKSHDNPVDDSGGSVGGIRRWGFGCADLIDP